MYDVDGGVGSHGLKKAYGNPEAGGMAVFGVKERWMGESHDHGGVPWPKEGL